MGKKDIKLKAYLRDTARYADLWNAVVFEGRQVIKAGELTEITPVYSKADGQKAVEKDGDLVMKQSRGGKCLAILALENQENIDYSMPARVMIQEALEYDKQLGKIRRKNGRLYNEYCEAEDKQELDFVYADTGEYLYQFKKEDLLMPIVTLVVYWGQEEWAGAKSLHEMIDFTGSQIGMELKKLIPEYPLHFIDISGFEHFEYFTTELRPLLELFHKRNDRKEFINYIKENETNWKMDKESLQVLGQLIGSASLKKLLRKAETMGEEGTGVCKALDDFWDEAESKGKAEGKAESLIELLAEYGTVPEGLRTMILSQSNLLVLDDWFKTALRVKDVGIFIKQSCLGNFSLANK